MEHIDGGIQGFVELDNGFELSIVKHKFSYGGNKGLYEIGVFIGDGLVSPKGWGDQVKGYLNEDEVEQTIAELAEHDSADASAGWGRDSLEEMGAGIKAENDKMKAELEKLKKSKD